MTVLCHNFKLLETIQVDYQEKETVLQGTEALKQVTHNSKRISFMLRIFTEV